MKMTLALDVEGDGNGGVGVGNVHLSGWFGDIIRIQTLYYAEIKSEKVTNPHTIITGLQINDLQNGISLDAAVMQFLSLSTCCRLIAMGNGDFKSLGITQQNLEGRFIEHLNLQDLWPHRQPGGLESLDRFLFPDHQKLRRHDDQHVTVGHSPERDSRVTLKAYIEFLKLQQKEIPIPSAETIRDMLTYG